MCAWSARSANSRVQGRISARTAPRKVCVFTVDLPRVVAQDPRYHRRLTMDGDQLTSQGSATGDRVPLTCSRRPASSRTASTCCRCGSRGSRGAPDVPAATAPEPERRVSLVLASIHPRGSTHRTARSAGHLRLLVVLNEGRQAERGSGSWVPHCTARKTGRCTETSSAEVRTLCDRRTVPPSTRRRRPKTLVAPAD